MPKKCYNTKHYIWTRDVINFNSMEDQYNQILQIFAAALSVIAIFTQFIFFSIRKLKSKNSNKTKSRKFPIITLFVIGIIFLSDFLFVYKSHLPVSHMIIRPLFELNLWKPLPDMISINKGVAEAGEGEEGIGNIFNDNPDEADNYHNEFELEKLQREHGYLKKNINIEKAYKISKDEISFLEYDYFVWYQQKKGHKISYPHSSSLVRYNRPVVNITIFDANRYTEWLSKLNNKTFRLPSEAEWEYAARAGTSTLYPWGNEYSDKYAQCNNFQSSVIVGSFLPNNYGLFNTSGNVWEITCSKWKKTYTAADMLDCLPPLDRGFFVMRGGSYNSPRCTSSRRSYFAVNSKSDAVGFRIVQEL